MTRAAPEDLGVAGLPGLAPYHLALTRGLPEVDATRSPRGFTLIELVVVMGLISVLLGLGIGFLQRGENDLKLAQSMLRDQLRFASVTARSLGLPTEVVVRHDEASGIHQLRTRVLRSIGLWHLEPGERQMIAALRPTLSGLEVPGRFGMGMAPDPETSSATFVVPAGSMFDLQSGFALRLDVRPDSYRSALVARLGQAFVLEWDDELVPSARVILAAPGERVGITLRVTARRPVPAHRWSTLELIYDGKALTLQRDGVVEARTPGTGIPLQKADDVFEVSGADGPIGGSFDEIQLLAYEFGPPVDLPSSLEVRGLPASMPFDRQGGPTVSANVTLRLDDVEVTGALQPVGVLKWSR